MRFSVYALIPTPLAVAANQRKERLASARAAGKQRFQKAKGQRIERVESAHARYIQTIQSIGIIQTSSARGAATRTLFVRHREYCCILLMLSSSSTQNGRTTEGE